MIVELILLSVVTLIFLIIRDRKPANMPPGPFEVPFLGQLPYVDAEPLTKLGKSYGRIATIRTGNTRNVIIFDYKIAKEVMAREEMSGRSPLYSPYSLDDQKIGGLIIANGAHWHHDRRFTLRNLRNLGMGKSYLEESINTEARALVEDLKMYNGEPIKYPDSFRTSALNIIWQMVASRRYDFKSKEIDVIYEATKEFQSHAVSIMMLPPLIPILTYLPKFIRDFVFKEDILTSFLDNVSNLLDDAIAEHKKSYDPECPRDFIDEYFKEMEEEQNKETTFFRIGALRQIIHGLFAAGSDTVSVMLKWNTFLMARYPEFTKKLRQQIDEVVPQDEFVSRDFKSSLPLLEAFTTESLRYSSMVIMNIQRIALRDTTIDGYFIPKGSCVGACNYAIHHDPNNWENPHQFNPERFIDEKGAFRAPKENFHPFGSGRRQCLAENLARMELFSFTAALVQNFDITPPPGVELKDEFKTQFIFRVPPDTPLMYKLRTSTKGGTEG